MMLMIDVSDENYKVLQDAITNGMESLVGKIILNSTIYDKTQQVDCDKCPSKQFAQIMFRTDPEIHNANVPEKSCKNCLHIQKFKCDEYKFCHDKSKWKPKKVEICPECGAEYAIGEYDDGFLCANCGADMRSNPNRIHDCYNCKWEEDRDSGECYECVKGIQDHFAPKKAEGK